MAEFGMFHKFTDRFLYNGLLSLSDGSDDILLTDSHGDREIPLPYHFTGSGEPRPQTDADCKLQQFFLFGRSYSDYLERLPDAVDPWDYITSVNTEIKDWNQAYALEADYIKTGRTDFGLPPEHLT